MHKETEISGERVKYLPDSEISTAESFHKGTWCMTISYGVILFAWVVGSIVLTYHKIAMTDGQLRYLYILTVYSAITILFTQIIGRYILTCI